MLYWRSAPGQLKSPRESAPDIPHMRHLRPLLIVAAALALVAVGLRRELGAASRATRSRSSTASPISKAQLDQLLTQAQVTYKNQKRAFPKAGSAEYAALQTQAITFLVQRAEFAQEANKLGIKVTDQQVEARLAQIKKQYFKSDREGLRQAARVSRASPTRRCATTCVRSSSPRRSSPRSPGT